MTVLAVWMLWTRIFLMMTHEDILLFIQMKKRAFSVANLMLVEAKMVIY